ncbi:MAG: YqiJ family protein [Rheinheimera sp.]|nr:YqiJ family protein [Rheinheimera sp.]
MLSLMLASENMAFSIALVLMLMIAVLEGVAALFGAGVSSALESLLPESELSPHAEVGSIDSDTALSRFLGWLRIGEVPLLMLLVIFLLCFGLMGLLLQAVIQSATAMLAPFWLAVPVALLLSLPLVRFGGGVLQAVMPKDETSAVSEDSLLGRVAVVTLGTARCGYPAQAKVRDQFGYSHYVQVEPETAPVEFAQGAEVLLLTRQGSVYKAIANPNPHLSARS